MKIEHLPINWVNGVKLTKDHFFGNYYNMIESLYGSIENQLTNYNYGLGKALDDSNDNVEFDISGESLDTLCVRLKKCNGLQEAVFQSSSMKGYMEITYLRQHYQTAIHSLLRTMNFLFLYQ